jgi:hypothetical protein
VIGVEALCSACDVVALAVPNKLGIVFHPFDVRCVKVVVAVLTT